MSDEKKIVATKIAHWPNQDVPCCDEHAEKLKGLAGAMGFTVSVTDAAEGLECVNCKSEEALK